MGDSRCVGVVVFGVGKAGKARIRDIGASEGNTGAWSLKGFVSRRTLEVDGVPQLTETEARTRDDVTAVIVSTEPGAHEKVVRKALESGKHVLVEFPVTTSSASTSQLYQLAKRQGLILHEENIGLLTAAFREMKEKLASVTTPIVTGELSLSGNYTGWAEDFEKSGGPFIVNVSLLQSVYELLGNDLVATGGRLEVTGAGFTATANLSCARCSDITVTLHRSRETIVRRKQMRFHLEDGTVIDDHSSYSKQTTMPATNKPGLFMQDFLHFVDKVNGTRDTCEDTRRTLHCLKVADAVHSFMGLQSHS